MDWNRHNFIRKWLAAVRTSPPPRNAHVAIVHEDGCKFFEGGYCDCEPEVRYILQTDNQRPGD